MQTKLLISCIILFVLLIPENGQAQTVLFTTEDAAILYKSFNANSGADSLTVAQIKNVKTFYGIFKQYGNYTDINAAILLNENPFVTKDMLINEKPIKIRTKDSVNVKSIDELLLTGDLSEVVVTSATSSSPATQSWQTAVLDGTAKFLAQRFKEELAAYYINTLGKKIEDKPFVKALFPKTVSFLKTFANQVYNTDIATFQAAAEEDLKNLPDDIINSLQYIDALKKDELVKSGLSLFIGLYKDFNSGIRAEDIINMLPYKTYLSGDYKSYLSVLRILSNSVRTSDVGNNGGPWDGINDVNIVDNTDVQTKFYFALLFEQLKSIKMGGKTIKAMLGKDSVAWAEWFGGFQDFYLTIYGMNNYLVQQKTLARSKAPDIWETLFKSSDIINSFIGVIDKFPGKVIKIPESVRMVSNNSVMTLSIIKKVKDKQYDQVIPNLIILLSSFNADLSNGKLNDSLAVRLRNGAVRECEER